MFPKIAIAQINSTVGDLEGNRLRIVDFSRRAAASGADIVLTPELSLTGWPPKDLLLDSGFYGETVAALAALAEDLADLKGLHVLVGHPLMTEGHRYNVCSVLSEGKIIGTYAKKNTFANHAGFDETRYFSPGEEPFVFAVKGILFGINIGEDAWLAEAPADARRAGAHILLVSHASPFCMNQFVERPNLLRKYVSSQEMSVIYANAVGGQDESVLDGNSFALDSEGKLCLQLGHCVEDLELLHLDKNGPQPGRMEREMPDVEAVYHALVLGTRDYVRKNGFPGAVLGLSGGADSALTLAIAFDALGEENVRAVMMPSPYTADISIIDAAHMAARLHVHFDVIPINNCFSAFLKTLAGQFAGLPEDTTEENLQARIRGTLLMALSNKTGSVVLTTGNKSELAVGYSTLYGDMVGGLAVIGDTPKTLVYQLCHFRNSLSEIIPERILTREPSAELRPGQRDQDYLPPYEVLDGIIQLFMEEEKSLEDIVAAGYDRATVEKMLALIRKNEHKRRQAPVAIRITPRGFGLDWSHPVTSAYRDK